MLVLDFETRSRADLKTAGTYMYVSDPSTDIICLAAEDMENGGKWLYFAGEEIPKKLVAAINNADLIVAHNAEFDMGIYEYVAVGGCGFPEIPFEKWYCSSAQCRVNALPASLDDAAWALGLTKRKNPRGTALIKALSIPQADGTFNEDPDLITEMGRYCAQDVAVTVDVIRATRPMTQLEHTDWLKTVEINEAGVRVDRELANLALEYAGEEQASIGHALSVLTSERITKHSQHARVTNLVVETLGDTHPAVRAMEVYKNGVKKYSLDKNIRRRLLDPTVEMELPENVRTLLELVDAGNKSSVSKFKRMGEMADPADDRVRGAFVFAGATQTLRYTSRGLQLHNVRRDCWSPEETEDLKAEMRLGYRMPNVMDTLSKLLRPAILPDPGNVLVVGDWSAIEARVMPWLSDTAGGDDKLGLFSSGADVYVETALNMGLTEEDRQVGKTAELACGYQGGVNAFQAMGKLFGLGITDGRAGLFVQAWRDANPWAVNLWAKLEQAAWNAYGNPGRRFSAGMVDYVYSPHLMDGTLLCILPGDNIIQYPKLRVEDVETPWGDTRAALTSIKASFKPAADSKAWPRTSLYGGLLAENCTQAFAAAILRNALRHLDNVIAHVHDEIILEVPQSQADAAMANLVKVMNQAPDWAEGLPLNAEPVIMKRYGK